MEDTQKKNKWHAVEFAGKWEIQDAPFYEDLNLLDREHFEEAESNAILAASAPELLEACQWAYQAFKRLADDGLYPKFLESQNGGDGLMPLVNAIKKATTKP